MSQHDIMGPASCVVSHESAALHTARHMQEMSDRIERKGLFFSCRKASRVIAQSVCWSIRISWPMSSLPCSVLMLVAVANET